MKLLNLFNWLETIISFFTLNMSGGGGGGNTTSTVTQTNLPAYAQPYFEALLNQTGKSVLQTDSSGKVTGVKQAPGNLPQQGTAGFTDLQNQAMSGVAGLSTPSQFAQATEGLAGGANMGYNAANAGLSQAFGYSPTDVTAMGIGTGNFGSGAANYYMDPYAEQVSNIAARDVARKAAIDQAGNAMASISRGTFGGSRQALLQAENARNVNQNIADIYTKGQSAAYQNAQAQFNADQARQLQAQQANQAAGLQAQQLSQQGQQYAAGLGQQIGLAGLQAGLTGSQQLGALGAQQDQTNLANLQAQSAAGQQQQAYNQQALNTQYQNAMQQFYYPQQQLQFYSDILRGNAGALGSTQVQYVPQPSPVSQIAGLGLAGLGLSKALG